MSTALCSNEQTNTDFQSNINDNSHINKSQPNETRLDPKTSNENMCIHDGCSNAAVVHPEWDNEYCSVQCCYNHCKATFQAWLEANKMTKNKVVQMEVSENSNSQNL
ncbi:uncharacterized protein LOC126898580 isoform X2 [Daktulosphaira vitifoliae]|uniref:uncharacterized protein LOC126898580 isoform X2 n=1 Tax=Daktulosphaira vitifoliae TaxID=58002 RepID=UPI0021AAA063|nr:uncharacterized protein LOC126898580 isoform X2 [Daktulosphaira vitifoliae]